MHRVYKITCLVNGAVYIGITKNHLGKRLNGHWAASKHKKFNLALELRKHGKENFVIEEIAASKSADKYYLEPLEKAAITSARQMYDLVLNQTDGGIGANGLIVSEEAREKLRRANLGKSLREETRKKISASNKGKFHTEESKLKISIGNSGKKRTAEQRAVIISNFKKYYAENENPFLGKTHNEKSRAKISAALKGKKRAPFSDETRKRMGDARRILLLKKHLKACDPNLYRGLF